MADRCGVPLSESVRTIVRLRSVLLGSKPNNIHEGCSLITWCLPGDRWWELRLVDMCWNGTCQLRCVASSAPFIRSHRMLFRSQLGHKRFNPKKQKPSSRLLYITQTKQLTQHVVSSVAFSWAGVANQDENTGMSTLKVFLCSSVGPVIPLECFQTDVSSRLHQLPSQAWEFSLYLDPVSLVVDVLLMCRWRRVLRCGTLIKKSLPRVLALPQKKHPWSLLQKVAFWWKPRDTSNGKEPNLGQLQKDMWQVRYDVLLLLFCRIGILMCFHLIFGPWLKRQLVPTSVQIFSAQKCFKL